MADIRINALATTAASTASDDFIAVDGSANGTRKLNAYSPTFGGNLTVSGTGGLILSSSTPTVSSSATNASLNYTANGTGNHNFNNAINVNGVNGVGKLNARAETDGNLHTRAYSLINGSGTGVALDALNDANNSLTGFYIRGNAIKLGGGPVTITDNLTVSGTAINLSTNNSTDKVVSIGYSTVPLYLTSSYDGSTFGLSGFSANSRPSGSSYTTPSNTSYGNLYFLAKIAASDTASAFEWKHAPRTAGTPVTTSLMTLNGSGNLLIGTTTDSGNGKLQLATHTTSAGGIGFGTDTALFRSAAGALQLESSATAVFEIDGGAGNTRGVVIQAAGTEQAAITVAASGTSLLLSTGSPRTTALTLDSSQNATFAALVKTKLAFEAYDGATADRWQLYTYTDKTFRWNYNGSGSDELSMDTSGNLIVAGSMRTGTPTGGTASAWKFGKYNTTAPSATGYVEVDIGGTLYKLLAST